METSKKEKSPKVWATSSALVSPSLTSIGVDGGKAPLFDTATMKKTSQLTFSPSMLISRTSRSSSHVAVSYSYDARLGTPVNHLV